jgi:triacylglycerol lipase
MSGVMRIVYLVPGFFGFTALGALKYFQGVSTALMRSFQRRGFEAELVECPTQPSGSLPSRADHLRKHVIDTGGLEADELVFIGHSTGGLDARLLLSPGVRIAGDGTSEDIGQRTRALITISTPHAGTPLATLFTTVQGRHLLRWLAKIAASRAGRNALVVLARITSLLARLDDVVGRDQTIVDQLSNALFRQLTRGEDDPVWVFLREVGKDQGAIVQLTPESLNLYNVLTRDRPTIDYASVVTAAPPLRHAYTFRELLSPGHAALAAVFVLTRTLAARRDKQYPFPEPSDEDRKILERDLPFPVVNRTNDGIVPSLSQIDSRLICAAQADHLDVVGQFARPGDPLSDWLPSGSNFDTERFEALWDRLAGEIVEACSTGAP